MTNNTYEHKKMPQLILLVDFPKKYKFITLGKLRQLVFCKEINGFDKVVVKIGRRILLDEDLFFVWLREQNPHWNSEEVDIKAS